MFEQNFAAFKDHGLHMAAMMDGYQPKTALSTDDTLYAQNKAKVQHFLENPAFLKGSIGAPNVGAFDRYGITFAKNMEKYAAGESLPRPEFINDGETFYLILFGLGPGLDLGAILKKINPTILIVIEPDLDNLYHSMHVDDWREFVAWQDNLETMFFLLNDHSVEVILSHLNSIIRGFCPAAFGNNPYFIFSGDDFANEILEGMYRNAELMLSGLGFLYDETLMMKNTYLNLGSRDCKILQRSYEASISTPVFVVGAGPSLDADMAFIHQHADQAIIISTGTALRSLLVSGITPDFHVELENIHVYSSIKPLSEEFDLSPICLVVSNAIDPHIINFFDKVTYYFRSGISPYSILSTSPEQTLCNPGPLVVNASFSLAIDIGARDIYLLGADFGSKGEGLDHAKDNVLYTDKAITGYVRQYSAEVEANFDGRFFTSEDFIYGLKAIISTIQLFARNRNIYNCSDGALVHGAVPIRSKDVRLSGSPEDKARDLRSTHEGVSDFSQQEFAKRWDETLLRDWINGFCDFALKILANPEAFSDKLYLTAFTVLSRRSPKYVRTREDTFQNNVADCVAKMFRGTLDMVLACTRYYLSVSNDKAVQAKLRNTIASELGKVIEHMRKDALAMLDNPTDIPPAKESGSWANEDFVQEANYTWGDTPRNAECPCGSGKRYKHCHGNQA